MIVAVVAYVLVISLPLLAAAMLAERIARLWKWPTRFIWAVTSLATSAVCFRALASGFGVGKALPFVLLQDAPISRLPASVTLSNTATFLNVVVDFPRMAAMFAAGVSGEVASRLLMTLWVAASIATLGVICSVHARLWRAARRWQSMEFAGSHVRVAPHSGPAIVGFFAPEIVVPHWLLAATPTAIRLVLLHETEHRNARDPLLLAGMWLLAAFMPWHPGTWYSLGRIRLAIECDCDARVISRGVSLKAYAELLLDQARRRIGKSSRPWIGAMPLLEPASHLERRLEAMTRPVNSSAILGRMTRCLRTLGYATIVATIAVVACESHVPTAADISGLDAASAEKNARAASLLTGPVTYYVNDAKVSADSAHSIAGGSIGTVSVIGGRSQEVRVTTIFPNRSAIKPVDTLSPKATFGTVYIFGRNATAAETSRKTLAGSEKPPFTGAIMIDGASVNLAAMNALDPSRIASIDVIKGPGALKRSSDPRAVNGLISIHLKR